MQCFRLIPSHRKKSFCSLSVGFLEQKLLSNLCLTAHEVAVNTRCLYLNSFFLVSRLTAVNLHCRVGFLARSPSGSVTITLEPLLSFSIVENRFKATQACCRFECMHISHVILTETTEQETRYSCKQSRFTSPPKIRVYIFTDKDSRNISRSYLRKKSCTHLELKMNAQRADEAQTRHTK